jgi:hypothetical protein
MVSLITAGKLQAAGKLRQGYRYSACINKLRYISGAAVGFLHCTRFAAVYLGVFSDRLPQ